MQESQFVLDLQVEAKAESLRLVLEARFGALPDDLVKWIEALTDLERVNHLFRAAIRVNRPEELPF